MVKKRIGVVIILLTIMISGLIIFENWKYNALDETEGYNLIESFNDLELIGVLDTDGNPWGENLCLIDKGEDDKAILFTPNTGIRIKGIIGEEAGLSFDYSIYDKVSNISDGVGIIIRLFDDDGIIKEDRINVATSKNIKNYSQIFNLEKDKEYSIQIMCDNGNADDDSGDWLILENVYLNSAEWDIEQFDPFTEYIRGVHYFGEEWPINFWNSELNRIEEDFEQIKEDGFNTIVLVIPWREFQPGISPIQYNDSAINKLDYVISLAQKYEFYVIVRVGYTWDYYKDDNESSNQRFYNVVKDSLYRKAWMDYISKIYEVASNYNNFIGGFITWEDFWNNTYLMDYLGDKQERTEWASDMGFQDYIKGHYNLNEFNEKYGCYFSKESEIYIPHRNELFAEEYYRFFDFFMLELLAESQQYFPDLSMEVRTDWDVYYTPDEEMLYYKHSDTYSCADATYTSIMYGIPQGWDNVGERVTYEQAMEKTEYILRDIKQNNGNKPIFIDQFLFMDNTPGYEHNAQIKEDDIGKYLEEIPQILKEYTHGYALWTYKNYVSNMLYNSQFALELDGWIGNDYTQLCESESGNAVRLITGGELKQKVPSSRNHFKSEEFILEFDVLQAEEDTVLDIIVGNENISMKIGKQHYSQKIHLLDFFDLSFKIKGTAVIDNIRLYSHEQDGNLYDRNMKTLDNIESIRKMNKGLEQRNIK